MQDFILVYGPYDTYEEAFQQHPSYSCTLQKYNSTLSPFTHTTESHQRGEYELVSLVANCCEGVARVVLWQKNCSNFTSNTHTELKEYEAHKAAEYFDERYERAHTHVYILYKTCCTTNRSGFRHWAVGVENAEKKEERRKKKGKEQVKD